MSANIKVSIKNLYKIFGNNSEEALQRAQSLVRRKSTNRMATTTISAATAFHCLAWLSSANTE